MEIIKNYEPSSHKIKALIYGKGGVGKTTFGATAKDVLFADVEGGLLSVASKNISQAKITTEKDLQDLFNILNTTKHGYKTLVIDSITEIADMIKFGLEKQGTRQMQIQDWGVLGNKLDKIIKQLRKLDMNVIILAQEMLEKDADVIQKIIPSLPGKSSSKIPYYMDIVGYLTIEGKNRVLITDAHPKYVTKDRTNTLGGKASLDFEKWVELTAGIILEKEEVEITDIKEPFTHFHMDGVISSFKGGGLELAKGFMSDYPDVEREGQGTYVFNTLNAEYTDNGELSDAFIVEFKADVAKREATNNF